MIFLLIGFALLLAIAVAVFVGMRNSYTASEGLLAIVLLIALFLGTVFFFYGIWRILV